MKTIQTTFTEILSMTQTIDLATVLANRWLSGKHCKPTTTERKDFMLWLLRQCKAMDDANIRPLFVTRDVSLDEVMEALNRPTLPGEIKWFPVSRLHNNPNPDLMSTTQNLWFRALHDVTHWRIGAGADMEGEWRVTLAHIDSAPESIHWLLMSEVAGQAAVAITQGDFPQQKLVRM